MDLKEALNILEKEGAEGLRMDFDEVAPEEVGKFTRADGWRAQPKWDGWFVALVVENGKGVIYSRKTRYREGLDCTGLKDNIYFAELIENTQWSYKFKEGAYHGKLVIFDALNKDVPYNDFLNRLKATIRPDWILVAHYLHEEPKEAFATAVDVGYEGIILLKIDGTMRLKVKKVIEDDYTILGIENSTSDTSIRLGGMAKALIYGKDGKELGRCGSMPHELKVSMFLHPEAFIGRMVTVRGKERFKSGALRHPAFVCLREDK